MDADERRPFPGRSSGSSLAVGLGLLFQNQGQPLGGPLTVYVWIGYALGLLFAGMYVAVNLAVIGFFCRERRAEFYLIKHLIVPILGIALLIPAFLGVLGGLTIPLLDIKLDPLATPYDIVPLIVLIWMVLGVVAYFVLRSRTPGRADPHRRRHDGGLSPIRPAVASRDRRPAQSKIDSGQWAVTMKFGMSTISLIRRSTATLHSR